MASDVWPHALRCHLQEGSLPSASHSSPPPGLGSPPPALSSPPTHCTTDPMDGYLVSPGRKVIGMVSGQPWPGCQRALHAEQNSMSQALHCTSWGVCSPMSWSWHTAWQVDAGHHVRQGSKSTSSTRRQKTEVRFRTSQALERGSMEKALWGTDGEEA